MATKTRPKTDGDNLSKAAQALADKLGGGKRLGKMVYPTVVLYNVEDPKAGGFLAGRYIGSRLRETVNGEKNMHLFELIETNCIIQGWDREARENIEVEAEEDLQVEIWGSAVIDGVLTGVEKNRRIILEYMGLKDHPKKGRKAFHNFVVVDLDAK